jgi:pectin methylesterase-like acyl-CoA thioesterase
MTDSHEVEAGLLALLAGVVVFVVGAPAVVAAAPAKSLKVCASGCAYSTIADALSAASNGDTIVVAPGTYAGGLEITKSVSLLGAGAA